MFTLCDHCETSVVLCGTIIKTYTENHREHTEGHRGTNQIDFPFARRYFSASRHQI